VDFDDIVIGSGLAALGAAIGLAKSPRVLVLAGPREGRFSHYDGRATVPSAYLGEGGLGNDWHGVIPTGWRHDFGAGDDAGFAALFRHFYPRSDPTPRLGQPWLFVPWRPIRPRAEFARLQRMRGEWLVLVPELALDFRADARGVTVRTASGTHRGRRLWVAAGALHTPPLLERSLGPGIARGRVSDHVACYMGQADGLAAPRIERTREGAFFQAWHGTDADALYTLRPARFAFRTLDYGIEQRAVFGLPTGSAIAKITRRMSPGLFAEAFYNRFGLFPAAPRHSVYAQVLVRDAYRTGGDGTVLTADTAAIRAASDAARAQAPFPGMRPSQRPELSIPGIHLHHSVDTEALARAGVGEAGFPVQVVDASVLREIGPEHHSFKMMLAAHDGAARIVGAG
jgi:hypothetical protein